MQFTSVISLAVVAFAVGISANPTPYGMDKTVVARVCLSLSFSLSLSLSLFFIHDHL